MRALGAIWTYPPAVWLAAGLSLAGALLTGAAQWVIGRRWPEKGGRTLV